MKILISIGHGTGEDGHHDSGALSADRKYEEFNLAKEIGNYAYKRLKEYADCEIINYNGKMYLRDREIYANSKKFDLVMEFHLNAFNKSARGTEAFHKYKSANGKRLAESIATNISKELGTPNRHAKIRTYKSNGKTYDYFGIVREPKCEALLIETVFIDSNADLALVKTADGQKKCGEAVAKAVIDFYHLAKISPTKPSKPIADSPIKLGDKVKVIGSRYATGQNIPTWVKKNVYTVENDPAKDKYGRALLKEIKSYVYPKDLVKVGLQTVEVGHKAKIKAGAVYGGSARGKKVPNSVIGKPYEVISIATHGKYREALLKGINSWVELKYLEGV